MPRNLLLSGKILVQMRKFSTSSSQTPFPSKRRKIAKQKIAMQTLPPPKKKLKNIKKTENIFSKLKYIKKYFFYCLNTFKNIYLFIHYIFCTPCWMDGWMDGCSAGCWTDVWMDIHTYECSHMDACCWIPNFQHFGDGQTVHFPQHHSRSKWFETSDVTAW